MSDMKLGELKSAPNFELTDFEGRQVRLSDYKGARHVVLILTAALFDHTAAGIWHSCARTIWNL